MYQVRSNSNGYTFETSKGIVYEVYFTKLDKFSEYFLNEVGTDDVYYFGVERMSPKKVGKDIFIKRTVAYIIITFFIENPKAVLLFNYSNDNDYISGRRKIFKKWFDEYAEHSLYQFYQHDYSDKVSLCALYRRHGRDFDKIRNGVKRITMNIGNDLEIGK